MTNAETRLILVYNADAGLLNGARDTVWKVLRPSTYPCSLCALTFGWVTMHKPWRQFLDGLPHTKVFHHRDDFPLAFPDLDIALPAILLADGEGPPQVLVSANALNALPDLPALIGLVGERLAST